MSKMRKIGGAIQMARKVYKNKEKIKNVVGNEGNARGDFFEQVEDSASVLLRMFRAVVNGSYKLPLKTILYAIGGVLYFVSPIDLIPDFILGIGFLDDITVIGLVIRKVLKEIKSFKAWERMKTAEPVIVKIS